MIQKLWINPPLAFGRVGPSITPCDNFTWGTKEGSTTGKLKIQPTETLRIAEDGAITSDVPTKITFKDQVGFKPVCPFFELHGEWVDGDKLSHGPITLEILNKFGFTSRDLQWKISVGNLKAFHYTLRQGDKIIAHVPNDNQTPILQGDITIRQSLNGYTPIVEGEEPLIPLGSFLPLGSIQLSKPTDSFPEFRIRFTPASGNVYAHQKFDDRPNHNYKIPTKYQILNEKAAWCNFRLSPLDRRTMPILLYARESDETDPNTGKSLGLVDDVCDGIISCSLPGINPCYARIVVGPPKFAVDRRPFTSIADGLTDRVRRHDVEDEQYYLNNMEESNAEIEDFFDRVFETMSNMNIDVINRLSLNPPGVNTFVPLPSNPGNPFPWVKTGRAMHLTISSFTNLLNILKNNPDFLINKIREPLTEEKIYNNKMPALIRGSDGYPMHITRRQYNMIKQWSKLIRSRN